MILNAEVMNALGYWWGEHRLGRYAWVEENGYGHVEGTEEGAESDDVYEAIYKIGMEDGKRVATAEFRRSARELFGFE